MSIHRKAMVVILSNKYLIPLLTLFILSSCSEDVRFDEITVAPEQKPITAGELSLRARYQAEYELVKKSVDAFMKKRINFLKSSKNNEKFEH